MANTLTGKPPRTRDAAFELCCWMIEHRVLQKELAGALDCNPMSVSRWRHGKGKPDRELAVKLEALTGGRVTVAMWDAPC